MSVIRKEPFIQKLIKDLTAQQKTSLLGVINGEKDLVNASFSNMPVDAITPVLFQLDNQNSKTGILVLSSHYRVLIAYHRFQDLLMIKLNSNNTYEKINEYLDINELRRLVEEADDHIVASEIDSGSATENQVLAADGDGGAEWKDVADTIKQSNVDTGDAVKLFGFDSEGNLVADDLPEGILVDDSVIEDSPNAVSGGAVYDELADIKEDITDINTELETKANVDGNYPTMTVGAADNLTPYSEDSGDDQDEPFIVQGTGCGNGTEQVDTGSLALLKSKNGNSVVVNQQLNPEDNGTVTENDVAFTFLNGKCTANGTASATTNMNMNKTVCDFIEGHKYLILGISNGSVSTYGIRLNSFGVLFYEVDIWTCTSSSVSNVQFHIESGVQLDNVTIEPKVVDLTQWFGSNDSIPSDLLSHPENFFRYYQGSLAYNTGELVNSNGRYLKTVGRNQYDKSQDVKDGYIDDSDGSVSASNDWSHSDYIKVIPNTNYYLRTEHMSGAWGAWYDKDKNFISGISSWAYNTGLLVSPANACFLRITTCSASEDWVDRNIVVSIYYDGESGYDQYYPYEELSNNDTGTETLRSAGSVSDSKAPDGTITRRVGTYTIGNSEGILIDTYTNITYLQVNNPTGCKEALNKIVLSSKHGLGQYVWPFDDASLVGAMVINANDAVIWFGFTKGTSLADAQAAVAGTVLNFELAEPTTEQGTPYSENVVIDDFGSMDFAGTNGVPQGNLIFYPVDYKAFIDTVYNTLSGDGTDVVKHSEIASFLTQQDLSANVTIKSSLTATFKKLYKTGNIATLSLQLTNSTGAQINAGAALASVPNSVVRTGLLAAKTISSDYATITNITLDLTAGGDVQTLNNIPDGAYIYIDVSYAVA